MDEAVLARVRSAMHPLKPPSPYDKVYKDECMFSYDSPESPGGLYVNLASYKGYGEAYVGLDHERTGNVLYLLQKATRVPVPKDPHAPAKPDRLAIGAPGGFGLDGPQFTLERSHWLVLMPERIQVPLPCTDLPERVIHILDAVVAHESAGQAEAVAVWEEERRVSKFAEKLEQLDTGRKISPNPKDWKCDETGVTGNLWLNLSTGFIGSGRANWDGTGGNGSALRHFEATGRKYPLAVKLGTITPHGADVYSYAPDEDDMVTDPFLAQHLAHWGIDSMQMEKTEKSMAEMQVDLNLSYEFSRVTESGSQLVPVHGPGATGLINLGNSCYMNSVLQVLFTLPELQQRYASEAAAAALFRSAPVDAENDVLTQLAKVGVAVVQGKTGHTGHYLDHKAAMGTDVVVQAGDGMDVDSRLAADGGTLPPDDRVVAVRPTRFKTLMGKGHQEFSSPRQQDAAEYFGHLLDQVARAEHAGASRISTSAAAADTMQADGLAVASGQLQGLFKFLLEDRVQCMETGAVAYRRSAATSVMLQIPVEASTNKQAVEQYKEREAKRKALKASQATAYIGADSSPINNTTSNSSVYNLDGAAASGVVLSTEEEQPVVPSVPLSACLAKFVAAEVVDDYRSAAAGGRRVSATKRSGFASFPTYLVLTLQRYFQDTDWTYKKLDVLVDVPDVLDLEGLRSAGAQLDETLQPEEAAAADAASSGQRTAQAAAPPPAPVPNPELVSALVGMGFGENGCKRAAVAVNNSGVEAAMEWVLGHMEDPDFNDPLPEPGVAQPHGTSAVVVIDADSISMLTSMGFTDEQARAALTSCSGNVERAGDWLFSHMDDLDSAVADVQSAAAAAATLGASGGTAAAVASSSGSAAVQDGPGKYELVGFISHLGANLGCGHYVCHVKKEGRWLIFNDEKVALSAAPPRDLGYLYLFKRLQ